MQKIKIELLYLIHRRKLSIGLFYIGVLIAFYGSMYPWFMWSIESIYMIPAAFFVLMSVFISAPLKKIFTRSDFIYPLSCYVILTLYQIIVNKMELNAYIAFLFHITIFYSIFRYDTKYLFSLSTFLSKTMAILLSVSLPFYFLYIIGFPLPYVSVQYHDAVYTFSNYYFFLVDDRTLFDFFPRFSSIFIEPSHLGTALAVLLLSQRGYWRKWYNIILITGLVFTFSLGAYVYLTFILFLNSWTRGKKIMRQFIISVIVLSSIVAGAFVYNDGDNLLHNLILLRLEVEDGDIVGNNRVTYGFEADFQKFLNSDQILLGTDFEPTSGESGYKVFFYDYGIIGILLLSLFYLSAFHNAGNKRSALSAGVIAFLIFGVDAFVLWYNRFIPLFCAAYRESNKEEDVFVFQESRNQT